MTKLTETLATKYPQLRVVPTGDFKFVKMPDVLHALSDSRTSGYRRRLAGLLPMPIQIGTKVKALPDYEVELILKARLMQISDRDMQLLVDEIHAARMAINWRTGSGASNERKGA